MVKDKGSLQNYNKIYDSSMVIKIDLKTSIVQKQ